MGGTSERQHHGSEPLHQAPLPPDLAQFLLTQDVACLMHETNMGTVFVVKLPAAEIASISGRVPMRVRHELYEHPSAPVIRTVFRIYDKPENPLGLETFTNVGDPVQRADFWRLGGQPNIHLLFYDEGLTHRLTKGMENVESSTITTIVQTADFVRSQIRPEEFDFDRAKADVIARTQI